MRDLISKLLPNSFDILGKIIWKASLLPWTGKNEGCYQEYVLIYGWFY